MASPYHFVRKLFGVGTGTADLALQPFQTLPAYDGFTSDAYRVRKSMRPTAPGYVKMGRDLTAVDMVGNGVAIQGQVELQRLSKLMGGDNK